eukprot:759807-Hanusia_phi.AAC.4
MMCCQVWLRKHESRGVSEISTGAGAVGDFTNDRRQNLTCRLEEIQMRKNQTEKKKQEQEQEQEPLKMERKR